MKDCVRCLRDIGAGLFSGKEFLTTLEGTAAAQRNSLGVVLQWGHRATVGLYVPAGPVRGQGQSTVNLSSSVNAAEEGNAVLLSRLPAPDDGEYTHPAISPLLGTLQ